MSRFQEQIVLGNLILFPETAAGVVDKLTPEMFTEGLHREMFGAVCDAYWEGRTIDMPQMLALFKDQREYMVELAETAGLHTYTGDFVRGIQDEWQMGKLCGELAEIQLGAAGLAESVERLEALCAKHREMLENRGENGGSGFVEAWRRFADWLHAEEPPAVKSGFGRLDDATGGFLPGSVFTLAARPGGGKSDFALNLAMKAAKSGAKVLYFTTEMTENQLMQRAAAKLLHINSIRVRDRRLTPEENASVDKVLDVIRKMDELRIVEAPSLSVGAVLNYVRTHRPKAVFIDYIGLMKRPNVREQYKALGLISNQLKKMALKENVAVVQLAQMNRNVEARAGGRPNLSDLRESGDLEQDSDFVGFLCPQLVEDRILRGEEAADVFLYLEKNRHGRTGKFLFQWMPQYHDYTEVENRYGEGN